MNIRLVCAEKHNTHKLRRPHWARSGGTNQTQASNMTEEGFRPSRPSPPPRQGLGGNSRNSRWGWPRKPTVC